MNSDEDQIRELVRTWMTASMAGDVDMVLNLMTDDVVFLLPGRDPMRKADFAAAARSQSDQLAPKFDGSSDIQEIQVQGNWAFMWSRLRVLMTPSDAPPMEKAGYALTILKKENGRWLLARDANLLTPVPRPGDRNGG